ncbi:hypothetical protein NZ698_06400 [Chryseobacterium sp. PBS4-4]|uniref:Peptidase M56 domain-containing protein n=1 Tax=Chryseobacterium edaphi TaxID=2976532 RepID=A0ABT2W4D9_9FLAO|nr:M56 family metallopeptidase [Chryseobacterium edaphi]MCU7616823.1 hypothetical protein [Chryseobacterium edaphi]
MEALILYFGKVIICSGVMFLYYQLSLKDKTFHHYNRFYLLSAMLISIFLPLIKVEDFTIEVSNDLYLLLNKLQNLNTNKTTDNDNTYFRIIFSALGLVSFYFLGKLIYGILKISQFKNQFQKETFEGVNFYQTNLAEAPFSYFKNLFWKNSIVINSDIGKQILKHEMVHIEQKHSYDKIFIEVMTAVFWFNPFFHIIKKEISLIHEYLADKKAVKKSDTKAFAQMLLASHFSGTQLPATSPFLSSNLKKRLKMLQKPQTKFGYARRIFALPVLFTVAFAYMVNAKNKEIAKTNIEIEKAVSEIKNDTIRPEKVERREEIFAPKISNKSEGSQKIADLSIKIKEKSKALKTLNPDSKDFEKNVEEISRLSEEISKVSIQEDFQNPEYLQKMRDEVKKADEYFKSDEYRNAVKIYTKKGYNFPESPSFPTSPNAPNPPIALGKSYSGIATYTEINPSNLSKKDQRKLEKLAKQKAELSKKQAEISKKQAEIVREKAQNNPWIISVDAHAKPNADYSVISKYVDSEKAEGNKVIKTQNTRIITSGKDNLTSGIKKFYVNGKDAFEDNMKITINGKESSKEEMDALDSNNIREINVTKNKVNGKSVGEISINTKK